MRSISIGVCAFAVSLAVAGCHKRTPVTALPPPPSPPPAAAPVTPPAPAAVTPPAPAAPVVPVVPPLELANRAFVSGDYDDAARRYEDYLRTTPSGNQRDQALFNSALVYAIRQTPPADWNRAITNLKQLIDEYPNSPYKAPASLLLSLHADVDQAATDAKQRDQKIKQLTTELDRLKKIDADRRKRP